MHACGYVFSYENPRKHLSSKQEGLGFSPGERERAGPDGWHADRSRTDVIGPQHRMGGTRIGAGGLRDWMGARSGTRATHHHPSDPAGPELRSACHPSGPASPSSEPAPKRERRAPTQRPPCPDRERWAPTLRERRAQTQRAPGPDLLLTAFAIEVLLIRCW